ncbi:MAG TPA: hypothetical protein VEI07_17095 [Planctomycetaceae bacterium]|nr:hypothetical protein [Planctomycetaceae bacterium]
MNRTTNSPLITLRIPGDWSHPRELVERLPAGFCLTPQALAVPNGAKIDFIPLAPDDQFASIFRSSCRRPPTDEELAIVARYTVNVGLTGPGGSLESALTMMQAGAAIVRAGGAGVFIDNSALAHGGNDWLEMTDDGGPDAISFAFASIVRGRDEVYTMGMQVMGFPNLLLRSRDVDDRAETVIEIIRYICGGGRSIEVGHLLADDQGRPRFQVVAKTEDDFGSQSPLHNPCGLLKIVSAQSIAEGN